MKSLAFLAAIAAFATFASARNTFVLNSNETHFVDPKTEQTVRYFGCDVQRGHGGRNFEETIKKLHLKHKHSKGGPRAAHLTRRQTQTPISINTYFHVLSTTANAGLITQEMANKQLTALNTAYNPYGISFVLKDTTFTTNDAWAVGSGGDMDAAKAALRAGTYKDLNIYFLTDYYGGNLGTCTLPSQVPPGAPPSMYVSDGCNVNANTMPGGSMLGYDMGKTAVHETGHWLGLLHTFEGYSCTGEGDLIDDTPMESVSTDGCPQKPAKVSCPETTGVDPIHNYMDYSTDACYESFTPLQIARIEELWNQFRVNF